MERLYNWLDYISTFLNRLAGWGCMTFGIGIVVSINIAVFSRYVSRASLLWPEEVARFLMIWITFLGGSIALKRGVLVSFQFLTNLLPVKAAKILNLLIKLIILGFLICFLYYGHIALNMYKRFTTLGTHISYFWPALGLYIGGIIMIVHVIHSLFKELRHRSQDAKQGNMQRFP
jgi:TRAP-type C4-dicarboxylate transport system permease small subunit